MICIDMAGDRLTVSDNMGGLSSTEYRASMEALAALTAAKARELGGLPQFLYEAEAMTEIEIAVKNAVWYAGMWEAGCVLRFNSWERLVRKGDVVGELVNEYLRYNAGLSGKRRGTQETEPRPDGPTADELEIMRIEQGLRRAVADDVLSRFRHECHTDPLGRFWRGGGIRHTYQLSAQGQQQPWRTGFCRTRIGAARAASIYARDRRIEQHDNELAAREAELTAQEEQRQIAEAEARLRELDGGAVTVDFPEGTKLDTHGNPVWSYLVRPTGVGGAVYFARPTRMEAVTEAVKYAEKLTAEAIAAAEARIMAVYESGYLIEPVFPGESGSDGKWLYHITRAGGWEKCTRGGQTFAYERRDTNQLAAATAIADLAEALVEKPAAPEVLTVGEAGNRIADAFPEGLSEKTLLLVGDKPECRIIAVLMAKLDSRVAIGNDGREHAYADVVLRVERDSNDRLRVKCLKNRYGAAFEFLMERPAGMVVDEVASMREDAVVFAHEVLKDRTAGWVISTPQPEPVQTICAECEHVRPGFFGMLTPVCFHGAQRNSISGRYEGPFCVTKRGASPKEPCPDYEPQRVAQETPEGASQEEVGSTPAEGAEARRETFCTNCKHVRVEGGPRTHCYVCTKVDYSAYLRRLNGEEICRDYEAQL